MTGSALLRSATKCTGVPKVTRGIDTSENRTYRSEARRAGLMDGEVVVGDPRKHGSPDRRRDSQSDDEAGALKYAFERALHLQQNAKDLRSMEGATGYPLCRNFA